MNKQLLIWVLATGMNGGAAAAGTPHASELRIATSYEQTVERDERAAGVGSEPALVCHTGVPSEKFSNAELACFAAYKELMRARRFEPALEVAVISCERHADHTGCRMVTGLPIAMGYENEETPRVVATETLRLAELVCTSGRRFKNILGHDVTGLICGHFARQFILAKDPEYVDVLPELTARHYASIYKPDIANRLYRTACGRWEHRASCGVGRTLDQQRANAGWLRMMGMDSATSKARVAARDEAREIYRRH